jgi:hypothetical protein
VAGFFIGFSQPQTFAANSGRVLLQSMQQNLWQLTDSIATSESNAFRARLDLKKPDAGLQLNVVTNDSPVALNIFGITQQAAQSIDVAKLDAYVRGRDLVALYDESQPDHLRTQVYWRALAANDLSESCKPESVVAAFELILSVNTSLLDSDPQVTVRSTIPSNDSVIQLNVGASEASAVLVRLPGGKLTYVEAVHPADACPSWIDRQDAGMQINHLLFQQRLEKGVILRARIRAAIISSEHDERLSAELYQHFAASEPPLTA